MNIKQCDRCKRTIENDCESYLHFNFNSVDNGFFDFFATEIDLCDDCKKGFLSFLKNK